MSKYDITMQKRLDQLARVLERTKTGEVPVLQLADAVQLCDERYTVEPVWIGPSEKRVLKGWEVLRASAQGRKSGVCEALFPNLRAGFIYLAAKLLANPPKGTGNMFPYFDVMTGKVDLPVPDPADMRVSPLKGRPSPLKGRTLDPRHRHQWAFMGSIGKRR